MGYAVSKSLVCRQITTRKGILGSKKESLTDEQKGLIKETWKTVKHNIDTVGVVLFIGYVKSRTTFGRYLLHNSWLVYGKRKRKVYICRC
jgi:hypothetical protein